MNQWSSVICQASQDQGFSLLNQARSAGAAAQLPVASDKDWKDQAKKRLAAEYGLTTASFLQFASAQRRRIEKRRVPSLGRCLRAMNGNKDVDTVETEPMETEPDRGIEEVNEPVLFQTMIR
ncbi:MAG: hypothetical protein IGS38_15365 [Synechococcales cyanobacterium M58_A2018_015]|nr:hypothetical protein [Synechococcales cyanobacterium M58_A2018_015]